jgi:GTP-binding protein
LKLLNADFVTSAARADGIPRDEVPRVALAGRSNVGKSSLINALCRSKIARTSAAPGKTRLVNFYRITMEGGPGGPGRWAVYLVDLPGYGYARGGEDSATEMAAVAESYFSGERPRPERPFDGAQGRPELVEGRGAKAPSESERGRGPASAEKSSPSVRNTRPRAHDSPVALILIDSRHPGLRADLDAVDWLNRLGVTYHVVATKIDKLARNERAKNLKTLETMFGTAALPVSATSGEGMDELWRTIARLVRTAE